ncbi:uncharacterized protein CLUP02_12192 [Colletotrichum lupini]|uniref:Uncharacterized protein n=1 Tax=Colletotrichum lupini TaxID=145971 RepID=A0A9Q8WL63_9PEZI|nr:uncharacterized protein CLUP02_12192 [Colletotrichum lupini]UQC86690.1 hypothetical protein CLUP02_12192 [Colletotrichum lupini]
MEPPFTDTFHPQDTATHRFAGHIPRQICGTQRSGILLAQPLSPPRLPKEEPL